MDKNSTLAKTDKGTEEVTTRKHKLDHRLRTLLLVVNGKNTVADLTRDFERYGDVPAMLQQLLRDGFIKSERPFQEVRVEASSIVYAALGPDSASITQEIENCTSPAALRSCLASHRELFQTALDPERFGVFWTKLTDLTG